MLTFRSSFISKDETIVTVILKFVLQNWQKTFAGVHYFKMNEKHLYYWLLHHKDFMSQSNYVV